MLPHAYPFRLLERASGPDGRPVLGWTVAGGLARGAAEVPPTLVVEMMAQAALAALPGEAGAATPGDATGAASGGGLLAGLQGVSFHRPLRAGDRLTAEAELVGRLGRLIKVHVRLIAADTPAGQPSAPLAEGDLLLALDAGNPGGERS